MGELPKDPIGAAWLAATFGFRSVGRLPVISQIGGRRTTEATDGLRLETYPEPMRPDGTPASHLNFHLRHEVPHLEFLAHLFKISGSGFVQQWVNEEPTGQYARRAAFLYEWLTGDLLQVPERLGGNYVDAVDDAKVFAASPDKATNVQRWRVKDNLPGTRHFCPMLVKTEATLKAANLDVAELFGALTDEFGEDLLLRAAVWMTLRESKASFAIEGEADRLTRIQRFADVMARRTGQGDLPLTNDALAELQREILGDTTSLTGFGLRQSPVFVGQVIRFQEVVHYVAPDAEEVAAMLEGLSVFLERTEGQSSVMRSAIAAFGFVYIHPLADGNGRIHRFLINDILRRDGVIPDPVILPISAVITDDTGERRGYDKVLDQVSGPLMREVRDYVRFLPNRTIYPDGVVSNFEFTGGDQARAVWRYPDLSPHLVYMSNIIGRTLSEQMRDESKYLRNHAQARNVLKEIVELPDLQADRVIRSIEQNQGQLSNALSKEIPVLLRDGIWEAVVDAVTTVMRQGAVIDDSILRRYKPH